MATLLPNGKQQFTRGDGLPLVGGRLYTYDAGTSTPRPTYADAAGTVPNTNPVILDARGEATVFWSGAYKVELRDAANALVWTVDGVRSSDTDTAAITGNLASTSDAAKGVGMVGYSAGLAYAAGTAGAALRARGVSITDQPFSAVAGSDCASAITAALGATAGDIIVPAGAFVATVTAANAAQIFAGLNRIRLDGSLDITVQAGTIPLTSQVVVNSPDADKITITGAATSQTTITGVVSVSGGPKGYSVTYSVVSSSGFTVGNFASIRTDVTGTDDFYSHAGGWRVTAIDSGGANRVTVLNTNTRAAFPTSTVTGGTMVAIKSVLSFSGCDGFRFEGGQCIKSLDRLAIVGDYVLATGTGTTGAHGIVIGAPVVTPGGDSNAKFSTSGCAAIGNSVVVSGWGEQGIAVSMRGALVANYIAACSNRKRGIYAEGASIRCKLSVASGNGEDGFIADTTGFVQAALSIASGNGLNGFWSTNNSLIAAATSKATSNGTNGYESRGLTRLGADASVSAYNLGDGYRATDGGGIDADAASAFQNAGSGFNATNISAIDCNNASAQDNAGRGALAVNNSFINIQGSGTVNNNTVANYEATNDSTLFKTTGAVAARTTAPSTALIVANSISNSAGMKAAASSIGDTVLSFANVDGGAYTDRVVIKSDGTLYPSADNSQNFGRSANRWASVWAGNGVIQTSDERLKRDIGPIPDAALDAWADVEWVQFRMSDGDRLHAGVIAQRVKAAFESRGVDPFAYGVLCHDVFPGDEFAPPTDRYSVRYAEAAALEAALVRRTLKRITGGQA